MGRNNILKLLEERVSEQQVIKDVPFPALFIFLNNLLGENPWKIIIPFSFALTLFLHFVIGSKFDETILNLFRSI